MNIPRMSKGLTLLEVVLAVTVFSIMAIGFLRIMDKAANFTTLVQNEALLRNKIYNYLDQSRTNTSINIGTETVAADEDGISLEKVIERLDLQNRSQTINGYYRVKITAIPPDGDRAKALSTETYVYQP